MNGQAVETLEDSIVNYWDGRSGSYSNGVLGELGDERGDLWENYLRAALADVKIAAHAENRTPRVLDLGCGPGFFGILFGRTGWVVDGIDSSSAMLARARANIDAAVPDNNVTLTCGDFTRLPFPDNTFDAAVARNVTWLMTEPEAAYAEWLRVLKPGGKLIVFDANWYRYLVDKQVDEARTADITNNVLEGWDEGAQATSDEEKVCEEIARHLPLTPVLRPDWDLETLENLGASRVSADRDAWQKVWTANESRYYAATPTFCVEAVK